MEIGNTDQKTNNTAPTPTQSEVPKKVVSRRTVSKVLVAGIAGVTFGIFPNQASLHKVSAGGGEDIENVRKRIWEQIIVPSKYKVHALRTVDGMPDINMERIHMIGLVFWPKDVMPQTDEIKQPIQKLVGLTGEFWEKALDYKTTISTDFLPTTFRGGKNRDEYTASSDVLPEVEEQLKVELKDQVLLGRILDLLQRAKTGQVTDDNPEYLDLVVFLMGSSTKHLGHSSANLGIAYINTDVESVINWKAKRWDNLTAHEVGHSLSFPDQYRTNTEQDEWWYDPDPKNIMGSYMWDVELSQAHLAQSVKGWVLNKKPHRVYLPFAMKQAKP